MNPVIIITIIASAAFIISIFAANWLNQRHIDKLTEQMDKRIQEQGLRFDAKIDGMRGLMNERFDSMNKLMNERFDQVDKWLTSLEQRAERLENILCRPTSSR